MVIGNKACSSCSQRNRSQTHTCTLLCQLLIASAVYRYATVYTMFPVFSLVLDEDVSADTALMYPELYKDLSKVSTHFQYKCSM
jgi:hypothetical protein